MQAADAIWRRFVALADPGAAISLGKILAARLLMSGQVIHSGSQTQVSFRIIETETGRITAAVTESFGSLLPVSALSEKMSEQVLEKLEKVYPIRAVVSEIKDQGVILNIGQDVGVHAGQAFKAIDDRVRLEVVSVQPNRSIAKITTGNASVTAGQRLEAL